MFFANNYVPAPYPGDLVKLPGLAQTFELLGTHGKDGFYSGAVAKSLVNVVQRNGGFLSLEDLKEHTSQESLPISCTFRNLTIWEHGPNGQGIVALMALKMLQIMEALQRIPIFGTWSPNSALYIHSMVECLKLAFADAKWYVSDPDVVDVPRMLSDEYLAERVALIDLKNASSNTKHGLPYGKSDTVLFCVVDKDAPLSTLFTLDLEVE